MRVAFQPSVAGYSYFKIWFPTRDQENRELYYNDLGSGFSNGG